MKVCIDCTLLRNDRVTGVERYIIELINSLLCSNYANLTLILVVNKLYSIPNNWISSIVKIYRLPTNNRILNDQIFLPLLAFRHRNNIDVFHFPVFASSLFLPKYYVLTNHDSTFWRYPNTISGGAKYYYKPLYKRSLRKSSHIITVSQSSKVDLVDFLKLSENKITVIHESLSSCFSIEPVAQIEKLEMYNIRQPYILSVGTIEPRKNLKSLIQAFQKLKKCNDFHYQLVIVGRRGWESQIDELNLQDIIFTGFINDSDLKLIYQNASLFVFPTLYEGFGFPLLEAMYCGTPVLASKISSLPEIGGNACDYIENPLDINEIASKIKLLLTNKDRINELIRLGIKNLDNFSWTKCSFKTINIYEAIINSKY